MSRVDRGRSRGHVSVVSSCMPNFLYAGPGGGKGAGGRFAKALFHAMAELLWNSPLRNSMSLKLVSTYLIQLGHVIQFEFH